MALLKGLNKAAKLVHLKAAKKVDEKVEMMADLMETTRVDESADE